MEQTLPKENFFQQYFESQQNGKELQDKIENLILSHKKLSDIQNSSKKVENSISLIIELEITIPIELFDVNFRENLISWIKKRHESRTFYIFYLDSINFKPILENELPLVYLIGENYTIHLPLEVKLFYLKKNDIVLVKLYLNTGENNQILVFGQNNYISCKINLNNNQVIEAVQNKGDSIKDNNNGNIYKRGDTVSVKITNFFSNQLDNSFATKINCEGLLIGKMI